MLILISSTPLFAQTGNDSTKTYNKEELQKIAAGLVEKNECKELLELSELDVMNLSFNVKPKTTTAIIMIPKIMNNVT